MLNWNKKEKPLSSLLGMGGGAGGFAFGGASKITVTGGSVLETDTHYIHFLTSVGSNPVVVQGAGSVDFLLVAGGGSGGNGCPGGAGGGGGGGVIYQSDYNLTAGSYTVNVGGGRPTTGSQSAPDSQKGNPTSGFGFTAEGGGAGLGRVHSPVDAAVQGGGGGGGDTEAPQGAGGAGSGSGHPGGTDIVTPAPIATAGGWGSPGGDGKGSPGQPYAGGGGGGAGGAGTAHPGGFSSSAPFYGKGGDGAIYTISGKPLYYGAGAGGGYGQETLNPDLNGGIGGHGGGGDGGMSTTHPIGSNATAGTQFGAGGGGHGYYNPTGCGVGGGSYQGVAILRYLKENSTQRPVSALSASGGNVNGLQPGNGYKYHTFTGPGSFQVNSGTADIEILIVGAGGGTLATTDCCVGHGGGGAGGILYGALNVSPGSYSVTIGQGSAASNGNNTVFGSHTALGGGRGGYYQSAVGRGTHGGSGGGAGWYGPSTTRELYGHRGIQSPSGTLVGYGNRGGHGAPVGGVNSLNNGGGGGAGGAGAPGGTTSNGNSGAGGIGLQFPQFTGTLIGVPALNPQNGYFAGGGGSGVRDNGTGTGGTGGSGGGGNGGPNGSPGTDGVANTGGGGGGPSGGSGGTSSTGGPGIVVIRYRV